MNVPRPPAPSRPPRRGSRATLAPRGELRAEKFVQAAIEVFLEKGYRDARLSDIVSRAGGSLATLYRAFGDKEGLAHAVMDTSTHSFGKRLQSLLDSTQPPEKALPLAARHMIEEVLRPARIVSHRIVIAEGLRFPQLRDWFFEHGIRPTEQRLAEYFRREHRAGRLVAERPEITANRFYMTVFARAVMDSVMGITTPADLARVQAEANAAVRIFLRGVLPRK